MIWVLVIAAVAVVAAFCIGVVLGYYAAVGG